MNTATLRPTVDWSNELVPSILWILQMFAITAPSVLVVLVVHRADDRMGPPVLAHHRRLLQGQAEPAGVGDGGAAAAVDDHLGPASTSC